MLGVEVLFLLAFAAWATVRAYDPAANHTEKPMDLMFMNSIWVSPTYPPHDAWLGGYAISYYYFGYWLLTTLGRLSGLPPEIAYNVGQACWLGLLLIGCVGVVYNLLRRDQSSLWVALAGGLLAACTVGLMGNLQAVVEWLRAQGIATSLWATLLSPHNFPDNVPVTGNWLISPEWWSGWAWRTSRVLEDLTLRGEHIEVIDEVPLFSYALGDNHPHVLGMPIVLLVIGMIQNLFFGPNLLRRVALDTPDSLPSQPPLPHWWQDWRQRLLILIPLGGVGLVLMIVALGALIFLTTWDFPPYWLLLLLALFMVVWRNGAAGSAQSLSLGQAMLVAGAGGGVVALGTVLGYLPYLLTAQSQASGFIPNLFNPTQLSQFLLMFGPQLCGVGLLLALAWRELRPTPPQLLWNLIIVFVVPLLFLLLSALIALNSKAGEQILGSLPLPDGASSYAAMIIHRWSQQGLTFLLVGALLGLTLALLWQRLTVTAERPPSQSMTFVLLLTLVGLLLVYAPEFVFLRDFFGSRMNTVFKFYYQAWLLLGLVTSYTLVRIFDRTVTVPLAVRIAGIVPVVCIGLALTYPLASVYGRTGGFANPNPTFDALAYMGDATTPERAAINWILHNTAPDALIVEGRGDSYHAEMSRVSAATGRPALLGWDGHERQWRGKAYGTMAEGRNEALTVIYQSGSAEQINQALAQWQIDYVYLGPVERNQYKIPPGAEQRLAAVMDLVFEQGDVHIYQRRSQ
jgi:YYY domain-containing protein